MKKLIVLMLFVGGCGIPGVPTTEQIETVTEQTDGLMVVIDSLQDTIKTLQTDGLIESERVNKVLKTIDKHQADIVAVNEAIKEKASEGPLEAAEAGWKASEAWNPYYGYGALALAIFKLWRNKKESDDALEEVVIGVEDSKKNGGDLKAALNASESLKTRKMVKKIRNNT